MTPAERATAYVRQCDAYDEREAELHKIPGYTAQYSGRTIHAPPCGCRIDGDGNLQSPLRIRFCDAHASVVVEVSK